MLDKKKNYIENDNTFLYGPSYSYIESLFHKYKKNNSSVDKSWQDFFSTMPKGEDSIVGKPILPMSEFNDIPSFPEVDAPKSDIDVKIYGMANEVNSSLSSSQIRSATIDSIRALMMIRAYRMRGHLIADLDPLNIEKKLNHPELMPETYGFDSENRDKKIYIDFVLGQEFATVNEMLDILKRTYCSTLGVEFLHITDPEQKSWIQERIEGADKEISFTSEGKKAILSKLVEAEGFEKFCARKYTGTKRFGLDGAESMIPALEQIIKRGGNLGVSDIVIGMPHRGRLNVLANVMQKPMSAIFNEFKGGSSNPADVGRIW